MLGINIATRGQNIIVLLPCTVVIVALLLSVVCVALQDWFVDFASRRVAGKKARGGGGLTETVFLFRGFG